jgi:hypothetical protein
MNRRKLSVKRSGGSGTLRKKLAKLRWLHSEEDVWNSPPTAPSLTFWSDSRYRLW